MRRYGKLEGQMLQYAPSNYIADDGSTILNFTSSTTTMKKYGFKPVYETAQPPYDTETQTIMLSYNETATRITQEWTVQSLPLDQLKQLWIRRNDAVRDAKLNSGVKYQNILFDSDTDQKVNLLATIGMMSDEDTITWYGMDNRGLLCTVADLMAIGGLITELHSYCWNMNAYIKEQINNAQTVEELNEVEINYDRVDS